MASSNYHMMRNFIFVIRSLGYPRMMSMENFRNPNFPLMADLLVFLLNRFDPQIEIEANVSSEQERLRFVMLASHQLVNKANLDVNVKKLYMADVNSIQELFKLAKIIQDAWNLVAGNNASGKHTDVIQEDDENKMGAILQSNEIDNVDHATLSQFNSFKTSQITSDIYQVATRLYDAIAEHDQNKDQLQRTLSKQLNIDQLETSIRQSVQLLQQEILEMQARKQNLDKDNEDLNGKLDKKQTELNRNKKRLRTLYSQRPGYMDELEKIEQEIIGFYDQFVSNSRCLAFLEQKLEEFEELERLKIEERNKEIKQMLEQIKIDDFLKNNKEMRLNSWNMNGVNDQLESRSSNDELALMVDLDEDALGRVSGSDFSDKDINEIPRNTESRRERQKTQSNHSISRSGKKERLLMANTVTVKSQRSPVNNGTNGTGPTTNRSAKTAKIFSYGSLLENGDDVDDDDDDDDDDDEDDSKSEANANKMSDSEIDLDAIESDDEDDADDDGIIKDSKRKDNHRKAIPNGNIKISNLNYETKIDDNF